MKATKFFKDNAGLHVAVYPGDNKILIAMSLTDDSVNETNKNLAGFAIWRQYKGKAEEILPNRICFDNGVNNQTTAETREWTPSDQAPFQKFCWIDVPADGFDAPITYRVRALYFTGQGYRYVCSESNQHVVIGHEDHFLSADGTVSQARGRVLGGCPSTIS